MNNDRDDRECAVIGIGPRRRRALLGVLGWLMLGIGLLVGADTGSAVAGRTHTTSRDSTTTIPEPVVTAVTTTTAAQTKLPGAGKTVRVGDMNTPEQFIIGQLYAVALGAEGYRVIGPYRNAGIPAQGIGGVANGKLDIYPEYLGVWNASEAHLHRRFGTLAASYAAARRFADRHGFRLLEPTPFSDTSCLAVLSQYAAENHVYSLPELARGGPVIVGAPIEFQLLNDGLPGLRRAYGLRPDYVQTISDGLQYWWLRTGDVDAAFCSTTDPYLSETKYVALRDPKHVFGFGNVVPVTTPRVLRVEGRAFKQTIERVDSLLTVQAMRGLNAEYQLGRHQPSFIATQFLEGNGVLPPSRYAPVPRHTSTTPISADS